MNKESNHTKIAGALILGAAIGAALGLLFAPAKGSETRRQLAKAVKGESPSGENNTTGKADPEADRPV